MSAAEQQNPASNELLEAALMYAGLGIRVLPLRAGTKLPQTDHGVLDASDDLDVIRGWWARWPKANVGLACGLTPAGWRLVVVDIDLHNPAEDGLEAWADMVRAAGGEVPNTPRSLTPSGGIHVLLRMDDEVRNSAAANFPAGIDIRGDGGYIVAPPSIHPNGQPYCWEDYVGPDELPVATPPEWLAERLTRPLPTRQPRVGPAYTGGDRPGDWLAATKDWKELLERAGATYCDTRIGPDGSEYELWVRPGKDDKDGPSATLGYKGSNVLKVFTPNWPGLKLDETYTPFGFYAATQHNGDQTAAASALRIDMQMAGIKLPSETVFQPTTTTATERAPLRSVPDPDTGGDDTAHIHFSYTDLGNARRLVSTYGDDLRYSPQLKCWYSWTGKAWAEDVTGDVHRRAKAIVDSMVTEIATLQNSDDKKALKKHWDKSQSAGSLRAIVSVAETEPSVPIRIDQLDADPYLFNAANGTINLSAGTFGPHQRDHLITKVAPVDYDPTATCPTWEWFVRWAMQDDEQMIGFVQRAVGYSLTGETSEQVLFFLNGGGENGKSTFLNTIQAILGDYAISAEPELLLAADNEKHPTGMADIVGRRFIVAQELDEGRRLAEATVKRLTGGERLRARRMHQDFFEFDVHGKFWIAANHRPNIRGTDHAIWRRLRLIPFTATIAPGQKDAGLPTKLRAEASGILNWALEGLRMWRESGLGESATITEATNSYRADQDDIGRFVEECCIVHPDTYCPARELRNTYEKWCEENGERPASTKKVGARLTERGFLRERRGRANTWVWLGIGLPSEFGALASATCDPIDPNGDPIATPSQTNGVADENAGQNTQKDQCDPMQPIEGTVLESGENSENAKTPVEGPHGVDGSRWGRNGVAPTPTDADTAQSPPTTERGWL
jgi:P4 family phage/plasmid primase-like protien